MRVDSNSSGHVQWYYFCIRNQSDAANTIIKNSNRVQLHICNVMKSKTLYEKVNYKLIWRIGYEAIYIFKKEKLKIWSRLGTIRYEYSIITKEVKVWFYLWQNKSKTIIQTIFLIWILIWKWWSIFCLFYSLYI